MTQSTCPACLVAGIDAPRPARALGVCETHYQQARRTGFPGAHPGKRPCAECLACGASPIRPVKARDRCGPHYRQGLKSGALERTYAPRNAEKTDCIADGCTEPAHAKGYCKSHYGRLYRGVSDPNTPLREKFGPDCTFEGCTKPNHSGGLCGGHAKQAQSGKPLTPLRTYKPRGGPCQVESHACPHAARHDGLCNRHYQRRLENDPDWDRPIKAKAKNGEGHTDRHGYRIIYHDGRARREHVVFVEELLGRRLLEGESVHHRNGNRADNRTDGPLQLVHGRLRSGNLELWSTSQPAGQEIGPKLEWTVEMQEEYAEFVPDGILERMAAVLRSRGYAVEAGSGGS